MGRPNWTVYPGPKNQPLHNQPLGASICLENWSWNGKAAMFVATEIRGNIQSLVGGGRNGQLVTGQPISMGPPARIPQEHRNQHPLGWVGAELPREWRIGCILLCAFFQNYCLREGFKASLNCDWATGQMNLIAPPGR